MKRLSTLAVLAAACVASSTTVSLAGGIIQSLPKDGSWTKYHLEMKGGGGQQGMSGTLTLRSVGTVTENGKKLRWIEMQMDSERNGQKEGGIMKFLASEEELKAGAKATPKIIRGWQKDFRKNEVKELTERETAPTGMVSMFFGGKLNDVKTVKEERTINYQKGQVKIATGTKGTLDVKPPNAANIKINYLVTQSVWAHKKIPFGMAEMLLDMKISIGDNPPMMTTMKFVLQDHGTGAKSALPDKK